ncbi:Hypothetical predicted protein, partial [Olea europaea subsp. europaea]
AAAAAAAERCTQRERRSAAGERRGDARDETQLRRAHSCGVRRSAACATLSLRVNAPGAAVLTPEHWSSVAPASTAGRAVLPIKISRVNQFSIWPALLIVFHWKRERTNERTNE